MTKGSNKLSRGVKTSSFTVSGRTSAHSESTGDARVRWQRGDTISPKPAGVDHQPRPISWQKERAKILLAMCFHIQARLNGGSSVEREIRRAAARWNGKPFKCDPKRKLRLSVGSLRRVFYGWKRSGAEALQLDYKPAASKLPAAVAREFLEACLEAGTMSRAEAIRILKLGKGRGYSVDSFYRAVPRGVRAKLRAVHKARLHAWRLEAALRKELGL